MTTKLNAAEIRIIRQFAEQEVISQLPDPVLVQAETLSAQSEQLSDSAIATRDDAWQENIVQHQQNAFMQSLMDNTVSGYLRSLSQRNATIKEVFITDHRGVLLGTSALLSDYFQGDEEKVTALAEKPWQISDIHFDASTGNFVSHYSRRLVLADGTVLIVIVGVSLDDVFRGENFNKNLSAPQPAFTESEQ